MLQKICQEEDCFNFIKTTAKQQSQKNVFEHDNEKDDKEQKFKY